jgi:hypothetical protein
VGTRSTASAYEGNSSSKSQPTGDRAFCFTKYTAYLICFLCHFGRINCCNHLPIPSCLRSLQEALSTLGLPSPPKEWGKEMRVEGTRPVWMSALSLPPMERGRTRCSGQVLPTKTAVKRGNTNIGVTPFSTARVAACHKENKSYAIQER